MLAIKFCQQPATGAIKISSSHHHDNQPSLCLRFAFSF